MGRNAHHWRTIHVQKLRKSETLQISFFCVFHNFQNDLFLAVMKLHISRNMAQMMKTVKYEVNAWAKFIKKLALNNDLSKEKLVKLFVSGA
jgi:hypothetical protein